MHEFPIRDYLHQLWKRRKVAGMFLISVFVLTLLVTMRQQKIYEAVTVIEIGSETPDVAFFQDVVNMSPYGWWSAVKYYETQYQILQSRALMEKVAQRAIEKGIVHDWKPADLTSHLQEGISVISDEKSRLARVVFDDTSPERAQLLANLIAETYIDDNLAHKLEGITQAVNWLNERLEDVRKDKRRQENELQKYQEEFKVISVGDHENAAKQNLVALTETLNRLKTERIAVEAQYLKLNDLVKNSKGSDDLLGVISSELLVSLKQQLAMKRTGRAELRGRYLEKHPKMVELTTEIEELEREIRQEVENEVSRLKTKFNLVKAQEDSIAVALERQKLEVLKIEEVNRRLTDIKVVTDTNQQLYETLQKKLKEADLSALVRSNNIRIVDRALLPEGPIRPHVGTNLLLAFVVGLLGGIGLALLLENLDDTLKTHEDIERYLQLPLLGLIPRYTAEGSNGGGRGLEFLPFEFPSSPVSEFYRTLRTNVLFLAATKGLKKILLVSTAPSEGKTVTALNLAVTLAQTGEKTIIVDLDLRRPKLHRCVRTEKREGITHVLLGERKLAEVIAASEVPHLDYLLAGAIPPNPAELLSSVELRKILDELTHKYDRVILDSCPIAPVTDAVVLAQIVDGVILVVRAGKTQRKIVAFAREQLRAVKAEVLGVVLNDVDLQKSTYGNYQYYRYGYATYGSTPEEDQDPPEPTIPVANA